MNVVSYGCVAIDKVSVTCDNITIKVYLLCCINKSLPLHKNVFVEYTVRLCITDGTALFGRATRRSAMPFASATWTKTLN